MRPLNFEKFTVEANTYMKQLTEDLQHPDDKDRPQVARILRAVLYALRDRISIQQSFHLISQLPMFLKAIYADGWKYREKPLKFSTVEEFKEMVKQYQAQAGEDDFDWNMSTEEIILTVLTSLQKYITPGEFEDILGELPQELKDFISEGVHHQ